MTIPKLPALAQDARLNWLLWFLVVVLPGGSAILLVSAALARHHAAHLPAGDVR